MSTVQGFPLLFPWQQVLKTITLPQVLIPHCLYRSLEPKGACCLHMVEPIPRLWVACLEPLILSWLSFCLQQTYILGCIPGSRSWDGDFPAHDLVRTRTRSQEKPVRKPGSRMGRGVSQSKMGSLIKLAGGIFNPAVLNWDDLASQGLLIMTGTILIVTTWGEGTIGIWWRGQRCC